MKCSIDDCKNNAMARGWCSAHYDRWQRNGGPNILTRIKNAGRGCSVEDCDGQAVAKLLCNKHHQRLCHHGDPSIVHRGGEKDTRWKGGRTATSAGYIYVWVDKDDPMYVMTKNGKNYALEHRLVLARSLGRPLEPHETVHHINGDRSDNRIENLQLRTSRHGPGVALQCISCGSFDIKSVKLQEN